MAGFRALQMWYRLRLRGIRGRPVSPRRALRPARRADNIGPFAGGASAAAGGFLMETRGMAVALRPYLAPAAWAAGAAAAALVFMALAGPGLVADARAAAALGGATFLMALVMPAVSIAYAGAACQRAGTNSAAGLVRWARGAGIPLGGAAAGLTLYGLAACTGSVPAALASVAVTASCMVSFGALSLALSRLIPGRLAGPCAAGAALLGLVGAPFWSRAFMLSEAGASSGRWLIGASPFLASTLPWRGAAGGWTFDPLTSRVLYDLWVGTDARVLFPGWIACAAGHLLAGGALILAACLGANRLGGREAAGG